MDYQQTTKPTIRFSFDDVGMDENIIGEQDNIRLYKLLKKYGVKNVIFYCVPWKQDLVKMLGKDYEIGSHTLTHPVLRDISIHQARHEIEFSKKKLEEIIKKEIKSFCYPKGRYNERVIKLVKKAGYKEARTTDIGCIKTPKNKFRLKTSAHACPKRKEYENKNWLLEAKKLYNKVINGEGDYFHLWGHSWELTKYNIWAEFEDLIKHIQYKF